VKSEKEDWKQMMDYFKENPAALLDAIPTPREDENELNDFRSGLTPKKDSMKFQFNNESSSMNRRSSKKLLPF
jgi:hypothetical protein